jgi:signal transduction histidine kinase
MIGSEPMEIETLQLLYQTSQRISTAMTVREVVAAYLEQVAAGGRYYCSVRLDEIDERGERQAVIVHGRWFPEAGVRLEEERLPYTLGEFDALLDAGEVVKIRDYRADPRVSADLARLQASVGRRAFALIPLIVQGRRIGRVNLGSVEPHDWDDAELKPYQVTAALLAAAIDSRQQHRRLAEQAQQLAVLEERGRLARELHDSVTQSLFSISLLAQSLPDLWGVDRAEAQRSLAQIGDQTREALAEMRALLFELRPADQGGWDLPNALRHHVGAFERRTGTAVAVDLPESVDLPGAVAYALSRITQEALANVARHAAARRVTLALERGPPTRLSIVDDGRGFATDAVSEGSFGLLSMRERAAGIKARLEVCSTPGQGTRVVLDWPAPAAGGGR